MLRPEQMSKVSVTGSKRVMADVVETVHGLNLLHITDYDDSWEGFSPGDPTGGAEEASDRLITIRSIENILDVDEDDVDSSRVVSDDAIETELEDIRERVNELDDRRSEIHDELRAVEDRIDAVEPFAALDIDLDLLSGYDSLQVAVGEGGPDAVERAVADAEAFTDYEVFENGGVVAVFARPNDGSDDALSDVLVGAPFASLDVPDAEGSPEEYVQELEHRKGQLQSELDAVTNSLEEEKLDAAGFLLAAEEKLAIEVQKTEAPLSFATTENAFIAEGWIPTKRYSEFKRSLDETVGEHAEVEEIERASFTSDGHETGRERPAGETPAATDGGRPVTMEEDNPPVVQNNPDIVRPFELLVEAVNRPRYREFDPSVFLFLTFPAFFGFMIGDVGYGIIYTAIGYYLYTNFDSPGFKSMGGVTVFSGLFTILFGILYGEIFGLHIITTHLWEGALGLHGPVLEKGLSPAAVEWARGWLVVSVLVGIVHLNLGWILDFVENLEFHDAKHAMFESGSWLLMMNGLWLWIFSTVGENSKPAFLYTTFSGEPFALGFAGFPAALGWAGLAAFVVGLALLAVGEPAELPEFLNVLVNVLSYTRLAAVLLAKAGMAFTVNLLFFGAYQHEEEFHFMLNHGPGYVADHYGAEAIMFPGLMHSGIAGVLGGLLVLVLGHALVLALGITSAGLQAVRLEYVEFFGKFYEGGGDEYEPFGYEQRYTTRD